MQAEKENSSWCGFQRVYGMHTVWKLESCSTVLLFTAVSWSRGGQKLNKSYV